MTALIHTILSFGIISTLPLAALIVAVAWRGRGRGAVPTTSLFATLAAVPANRGNRRQRRLRRQWPRRH